MLAGGVLFRCCICNGPIPLFDWNNWGSPDGTAMRLPRWNYVHEPRKVENRMYPDCVAQWDASRWRLKPANAAREKVNEQQRMKVTNGESFFIEPTDAMLDRVCQQ